MIFGRDMILPIKHIVDWGLINQQKQAQIIKDNIHKNRNQVYQDYKFKDKVMLTKHTAYKYETPYTGLSVITQCFINGMVNLQYNPTKGRYKICQIKPYKSYTYVEDINQNNMYEEVNI